MGAAAVSAGEWFILVDSVTTQSIGTLVITPACVTALPDGVASLGSIGDAALTTVGMGLAPASIGGEDVNVPEFRRAATARRMGLRRWRRGAHAELDAVVYIVPVGTFASAESRGR